MGMPAPCKNHPDTGASGRCAGCAESYCGDCLVEMLAQTYCASCKVIPVQGRPAIEELTRPCSLADEAFKMGVVGLFVFGIALGPMAILKAREARNTIAQDPSLSGSGKTIAAELLGYLVLALWLLNMATKAR